MHTHAGTLHSKKCRVVKKKKKEKFSDIQSNKKSSKETSLGETIIFLESKGLHFPQFPPKPPKFQDVPPIYLSVIQVYTETEEWELNPSRQAQAHPTELRRPDP